MQRLAEHDRRIQTLSESVSKAESADLRLETIVAKLQQGVQILTASTLPTPVPAPRPEPPSLPVAPAIPRWLFSLLQPSTPSEAESPADPGVYLDQLRDSLIASRRLAERLGERVRLDVVHLAARPDGGFTMSTVTASSDPGRPLRCRVCESLPGTMTYQHFVGATNMDGTEMAVFLPAGSVIPRERSAIGFKLLVEDAPPEAAVFRVSTVEQPARLERSGDEGDRYRVTQPMRLRLAQ